MSRYDNQYAPNKAQGYLRRVSDDRIGKAEALEIELTKKGLKGEINPASIAECFDIPLEYGEKIYQNYLDKKAEQ